MDYGPARVFAYEGLWRQQVAPRVLVQIAGGFCLFCRRDCQASCLAWELPILWEFSANVGLRYLAIWILEI